MTRWLKRSVSAITTKFDREIFYPFNKYKWQFQRPFSSFLYPKKFFLTVLQSFEIKIDCFNFFRNLYLRLPNFLSTKKKKNCSFRKKNDQ